MVFGVTMVRNEADIVASTITHMATQVHRLIVADNGSTDGTREILDDLASSLPITVVDDPVVGYFQAEKMTRLAAQAAAAGADWIVPFDADEWWYSPHGVIADLLDDQAPGTAIVTAELYDHVATGQDPDDQDPVARIGWRREEPGPLPKVACRATSPVRIHQGNHDVDYGGRLDGLLVIRHFPYRSVEQLISKVRQGAAAYAATDLPSHQGAHWRAWGELLEARGETAIGDLFRAWYWRADPTIPLEIQGETQPPLIFDPAPR